MNERRELNVKTNRNEAVTEREEEENDLGEGRDGGGLDFEWCRWLAWTGAMKGNRGIRIRSQVERQTQDPGGCGWKGKHSFLEKGVCRKSIPPFSHTTVCMDRYNNREGGKEWPERRGVKAIITLLFVVHTAGTK